MNNEKQAILDALLAFAKQRPGLDVRNYISDPRDKAGAAAYCAEVRSITKDLRHARELLRAVELADGLTADQLKEGFRAFSGRLTLKPSRSRAPTDPRGAAYELDYCTGQYWPTEYRRAVCAVCAAALWEYYREAAHSAQNIDVREYGSLGEELRAKFRSMFGRSIANRWFN